MLSAKLRTLQIQGAFLAILLVIGMLFTMTRGVQRISYYAHGNMSDSTIVKIKYWLEDAKSLFSNRRVLHTVYVRDDCKNPDSLSSSDQEGIVYAMQRIRTDSELVIMSFNKLEASSTNETWVVHLEGFKAIVSKSRNRKWGVIELDAELRTSGTTYITEGGH